MVSFRFLRSCRVFFSNWILIIIITSGINRKRRHSISPEVDTTTIGGDEVEEQENRTVSSLKVGATSDFSASLSSFA